ncbi:MAG: hypothetical protein JO023_29805 [Chloroflexi bacterium]|nr:hypothetical protein [Chloroflexota bacterium]
MALVCAAFASAVPAAAQSSATPQSSPHPEGSPQGQGSPSPGGAESVPSVSVPTAVPVQPANTNTPFPTNTPTTVPSNTPTRAPTPVPAATATNTPISYASATPTSVGTPPPTATPAGPTVALIAGVQPVGGPSFASISPTGGQFVSDDGSLTVQALADPARPPLTLVYQPVDARTLPTAQNGLSLGFSAFQLTPVNDATQATVASLNVPIDLVLKPSPSDLALALGRLDRLYVGTWNGSSWTALPCAPNAANNTLVCSTTQSGLFVPLIALPINPFVTQLDFDITSGHFYTQGNGFGGGGGLGYTVVDDGDAPMWSEYQRLGGVGVLGFPVSNRFLHQGLITQAFQNAVLQWDGTESVPLNTLDELHAHGSDNWLDQARQIPPAPPDGQPSDASILEPFPDLLNVYNADPDRYGLPVSVKDYGQLGSARFQRSTLQVWEQDQPFAPAGTVIAGAPGELARAAGLWPLDAVTPAAPPGS